MGSGRPDSLFLASSISSLISSPYVLLAAAAVVVIAVLIVLIMVLRGGSKKTQLASEYDDDQGAWESEPRKAASQSNREYNQQDQAFPWQGGAGRADGGRQPAGGRRGNAGRDAQGDWDQADGNYAQRDGQWDAQGQPISPAGQWGGANNWDAAQEPAMGRSGGGDHRAPQGQAGSRDAEWGWGSAQASSGNQNEWGRGPAAPPAKGSDQDGWGQPSAARGRGQDQWDQGGPSQGQEQDGWGQPPAARPQQGGWSQPAQNEWGQAAPSRPREQNGWGQPSQNDWGQPAPSQPRDQGQWGQPSQPARPAQPGPSRPVSQPSAGDAGSEWGQPRFERPAANANQQVGGWEQREPANWQAPKQEEPPAWQGAGWNAVEPEQQAARGGQRSQPISSQQWGQAGHAPAEAGWETPGAVNDWNQPAQPPRAAPSRPISSGGMPGGIPAAPSGNADWGQSNFDGPTVRPAQQPAAGGWEARDAAPWSPAQDAAPPAWQAPSAAPTSGPVGGAQAPAGRGADMRQMSRVSPEATAYSTPASGVDEGEAAKTVVVRRDAGGDRIPAIVVRQGKEPGRTYEMRKEHISIGRSRESDIFLEDLAVSRLHATIYRDEMGGYRLRDEHSANGTSLNGQRVSESALQEGDEIQLGQTILAFMRR